MGVTNVCSNVPSHMINMAAKKLKNLLLGNQKADDFES